MSYCFHHRIICNRILLNGDNNMKGDKERSYLVVDVSDKTGTEYWELVDWLTDHKFKLTDADFNDYVEE